MLPFLEQFYQDVDEILGDVSTSGRYPKERRLRDLRTVDRNLFESLLNVTGPQSTLGYAEATILLQNGKDRYPLPVDFRHFWGLVRRDEDGLELDRLGTKHHYDYRYAIEILSPSKGFRLVPPPILAGDEEEWIIEYSRAPGILHYATTRQVTPWSLVCGSPPVDAGTLVKVDHYYNGMEVRLFDSEDGIGVPQYRDIRETVVRNGQVTLFWSEPLSPVPSVPVKYELCPTISGEEYSRIYAVSVCIDKLISRRLVEQAAALTTVRDRLFAAARSFFASNTADRGPERMGPLKPLDVLPYGEMPWL